jgi:exosome complex RNA-binding protein Rrp42 (RNase PH superfamily)
MGETTVVVGIKAEIAEPDLATPHEGFIGELRLSYKYRAK